MTVLHIGAKERHIEADPGQSYGRRTVQAAMSDTELQLVLSALF